jgi:hypothetical protein
VRAALGRDLAALEEKIDQGPAPQSRLLDGWRVVGRLDVQRKKVAVKNVLGVLEGEGPTADETVIVGAHYDHLGLGGAGSLVRGEAIHNGADDNASGVAVMIEVARQLALRSEPRKRRLVFMALTGEERGLLGSNHYLDHPLFPLEKTVAMINLDMVGRLRNDRLTVFGSGSGKGIGQRLEQINEHHGFELALRPSGFSPSDNTVFYAKKIPVLHFFTGTHGQYHRPSDDFQTLNVAGMRRIAALVSEVVVALSNAEKPPEYVAIQRASRSGGRPYLGTVPDLGFDGNGYRLRAVVPGGPAERAGLRDGDVVVRFADDPIDGLEAIDQALRQHRGGDRVRVVVRRGEQEETFEVELDPPK